MHGQNLKSKNLQLLKSESVYITRIKTAISNKIFIVQHSRTRMKANSLSFFNKGIQGKWLSLPSWICWRWY